MIPSFDITIAGYKFLAIVGVSVKTSENTLTNTCTIELAKSLKYEGGLVSPGTIVKRGDQVTVSLGYDNDNKLVFKGYVVKIEPGFPFKIQCEDEMFLFKTKHDAPKLTHSGKLKGLLEKICPAGTLLDVNDVSIGDFIVSDNMKVSLVLDAIKRDYPFKIYFYLDKQGRPVLYAGTVRVAGELTYQFDTMRNIINSNLDYINQDDIKLKIKGISINKANQKFTVDRGDADGQLRTYYWYDVSESELVKLAEAKFNQEKKPGYRGSITVMGKPFMQVGDTFQLIDNRYGEGIIENYEVEGVNYSLTHNGGYKQEIILGGKI